MNKPFKPRLSIRHKVYRDVEGFGITGHIKEGGWGVSVFVAGDDRAFAEVVKSRLLANEDDIFRPLEGKETV